MKLLKVIIFSVLMVVLVACGSKKEESNEINVWAWDPNFNIKSIKLAEERYNEKNPEDKIVVNVLDMARRDLEQKFLTVVSTGDKKTYPDVILLGDNIGPMMLDLYGDQFAKMDDVLNYKEFAPYKVSVVSNEGIGYGIPFDTGVTGLYYRIDILSDAGFTEKDLENITWDRFIEIGKVVKEKIGKDMISFVPNELALFNTLLQSQGGTLSDANGNITMRNNIAAEASLTTIKNLLDANIVNKATDWTTFVGAINGGAAASSVSGSWFTATVTSAPEQKGLWRIAPTPRVNNQLGKNASNEGGSSWYVMDTKKKELSKKFIKETLGSDIELYQTLLTEVGMLGTYLPAAGGSAYEQSVEFFGGQKISYNFVKWMEEIPSIEQGKSQGEIGTHLLLVLPDFYNGRITAKEALDIAHTNIEKQLQK